jgi:REP element-mobilizing transposase RayT
VLNQVRQKAFRFRTWGGKRRGAGAKRKGPRPRVEHQTRPELKPRFPVHVTSRILDGVCHLRQRHVFQLLKRAFQSANQADEFHVVEYSVQGNHIHFLVEAEDTRALARGMQGLSVRVAKALNRAMRRRGRVFADRYHAVVLRSPTQTARALHYVLHNRQHHAPARYSASWRDPFSSVAAPLVVPRTWLLEQARAGEWNLSA